MLTEETTYRQDDVAGRKRAVLTAPLWMQSTKSSSRLVAEAVGVSQSFVSRTWRESLVPDAATDEIRTAISQRQMALVGFAVGATGSCLVLNPSRASRFQPQAGLSISSKRRLRAVLAADLLRGNWQDMRVANESRDLWSSLELNGHSCSEALVLVVGNFVVPQGVQSTVHFVDSWHWQKLMPALEQLAEVSAGPRLLDLEWRLRRWYQAGKISFSWVVERHVSATPSGTNSARRPVLPSKPGGGLTEEILMVLRQGLIDGTFSGESEISLGTLSRLLTAPLRDLRPAVRALAEDGLVTAARSESIVVRLPSLDDVSETYMARRALGAIIVRAASRWSPESRSLVKKHLEELRDCVRRNDTTRAHYVDMDFQIALFAASGLSRIPSMLETLTRQAFMHFAVIGARYTFSPARIHEQNTAIYESIDAGDLQAATLGWQSKMDEGLEYIAQHISSMTRWRSENSKPGFGS